MSKVCIITNYRKTGNYGAVLQAYALNRYINSIGLECKTLNYLVKQNKLDYIKSYIRKPKIVLVFIFKRFKRFLVSSKLKKRMMELDIFKEKIPHTTLCSQYNAERICSGYQYLICGSDQIWRPSRFTGEFDNVNFLNFPCANVKKISYATSFGITHLSEQQKSYISATLNSFTAVSVREFSGRKLLQEILQCRDIQVVCDPVFLLSKGAWLDFSHIENRSKYVFVYFIKPNIKVYREIHRFVQNKGLYVINFPYMGYEFNLADFFLPGIKKFDADPHTFVSYIQNAEYVFTDSFHACSFSIMFHKKVNVNITNYGTRISNLLEQTGIPKQGTFLVIEGIEKEIDVDWGFVDLKLESMRTIGEKYLQKALFGV